MTARRQIVLALVGPLEPVVARISELSDPDPPRALNAQAEDAIFGSSCSSTPDSWLCAATEMLAEIGRLPRSLPQLLGELAADGGPSPGGGRSPGKAKGAQFRWACDHRLRGRAFDTLSDSSRRHNPWAAGRISTRQGRSACHAHASRGILGRAWCQVIWRLWHDHDTYEPKQHTALQRGDRRRSLTDRRPLPGRPHRHLSDGSVPPSPQAAPQGRARSIDGKPTVATTANQG